MTTGRTIEIEVGRDFFRDIVRLHRDHHACCLNAAPDALNSFTPA